MVHIKLRDFYVARYNAEVKTDDSVFMVRVQLGMLRSEELKVDDVNEREIELVEDAYTYLTNKTYPADATKNEKRIIRKKQRR